MITITSNSMDELNGLYRKLKPDYKALDKIRIDQERLVYRMDLKKNELKPFVKNQLEKLLDFSDELNNMNQIDERLFEDFLYSHKNNTLSKQMFDIYQSLNRSERQLVVQFVADELGLFTGGNKIEENLS